MYYLLGFVLASVFFVQTLRYGQARGVNILAVVTVNYVLAAALTLGGMLVKGVPWGTATAPVVLAGGINGVLFFVHIPFIIISYRLVGVGITSALVRTGVVIPALVAWFAWGELMGRARWTALALVPVAMILMHRIEPEHSRMTLRANLALFGCFMVAGMVFTIHKYAEIHFSPPELEIYKVALFTASTIASTAYMLARRIRLTAPAFRIGAFIGLCNAFVVWSIMMGLAVIPAVVFYPTSACLGIILNVLVAHWLWKERLLKRQFAGIAIAIVIVLLTNAPVQ